MSTIRAYLGVPGLVDVGYRFYSQNTPEAARQTAGIVDEGEGWYSVAGVTLVGDHVRWDSTGTPDAVAREDLAVLLAAQRIADLDLTDGKVNVGKINDAAVLGTGVTGDLWRG